MYHKLNIVINEGAYNLDLNGVTYFTIERGGLCDHSFEACYLSETATPGNGAIGGPLTAGDEIGPDQVFNAGTDDLRTFYFNVAHQGTWGGTWCSPGGVKGCNAITGYLGLSVQYQGETFYGWLELSIPADSLSATLMGVAYENTLGMEIRAGQK